MNPRTLTVDKDPRLSERDQGDKEGGIVEQDHRRINRLVRPWLGFKGFHTARRTVPLGSLDMNSRERSATDSVE